MESAGKKIARPVLDIRISIIDFNEFYWLKEELVAFCREVGISPAGGKIALAERIRTFLATGEVPPSLIVGREPVSSFDWSGQPLHDSTIITDSYKNTENARRFFREKIGPRFSFNVPFMRWMSENAGRALDEAVEKWRELDRAKKQAKHPSEIAPQFEYNRYTRAFLADNPGLSSKDARKFWLLKSRLRGTNEYERTDLSLS